MPHVKVKWQDSCHDSKTLVHKQTLKKLLFPPGSFTSEGGGAGGGVTAPSSCPWPRGGGTPSPGWTHPGGSTRAPRWVMNIPLMSVEIYGRRTIVLVIFRQHRTAQHTAPAWRRCVTFNPLTRFH